MLEIKIGVGDGYFTSLPPKGGTNGLALSSAEMFKHADPE